ncbi:MAG: hypothetical protein ABI548_24535 [Polyangiaceae bacterium]
MKHDDVPRSLRAARAGFVRVGGAREHNLKNVDAAIPRGALPLKQLATTLRLYADSAASVRAKQSRLEQAIVAQRIAEDMCTRLSVLLDLGRGLRKFASVTPHKSL